MHSAPLSRVLYAFLACPIACFVAALPACSPTTPDVRQPLAIHMPSFDLTLDPHRMEDSYSMTAVLQLYRGLFRYTADADLKPDLVESWTESEDHRTFVFTLRERMFSDGSPITASHVRNSFARIFLLGAAIGADIDYIGGAKTYRATKALRDLQITVLGPLRVQFKLDRPSSLFLKHLATVDCAVLPLAEPGQALAQDEKLVASGPFRITKRDRDSIRLSKWRDDPLDSAAAPREIDLLRAEGVAPETLFREGRTDSFDTDAVSETFSGELKRLGWKQYVTEIARERFVIMNPDRVPRDARRYLLSRVKPEEIKDELGLGYFTPAYGLIPIGIPGELSPKDVEAFRKRHAGARAPKRGNFKLTYFADDSDSGKLARHLKAKWDQGNFLVQLDPVDRPTLLSRMFKKQGDLILGGKGIDYPDGYSVLTYFKSGYEGNYFHVADLLFDRHLEKAVTIFDASARAAEYRALQLEILEQHTIIPLFFGSRSAGFWSPRVAKVPAHPMGLHMLPFETIEMRR